jgi:hypothetical protein
MGLDVSGMGAAFSNMSAGDALTVASTAFSAMNQISQGNQQKKYADFQANQAMADAQAEREMGQVRADQVRKAGKTQQSEAKASLAAGGVEVGAGTALTIDQEIYQSSEERAMQEILYGKRSGERLEQEAAGFRAAGRNARNTGYTKAIGSVLSSGAEYYKTRAYLGNRAEQPASKVEERGTIRIR